MRLKEIFLIFAIYIIAGCSGGGGDTSVDTSSLDANSSNTVETNSSTEEKELKGYYIDDAIVNANYNCGKYSGATDSEGAFVFEDKKGCKLSVANIVLQDIPADKLTDGVVIFENNLTIARFLHLLDTTKDDKKIVISDDVLKALQDLGLTKIPDDIDKLALDLNSKLKEENITLEVKSEEEILSHLQESYIEYKDKNHFLTDSSLDLEDKTAPTLTLYRDSKIFLDYGSEYKEPGFSAVDDVDGNITNRVVIEGSVDIKNAGEYTLTYRVKDKNGNEAVATRVVIVGQPYAYIPRDENLTDAMAIRFLNKATFGANKESIEEIKSLGVVAWVDKQLSEPLVENNYLIKTIEMAKEAAPNQNPYSVEEYLEDNDIVFNKQYASFHSPTFMQSAWFDIAITSKDQLRQKLAYALSQIIVESDFEPIFERRGEALSRYFDILAHNAFKSYKDLLTEISFSSGMAMFLTYNGNKALYQNDANVSIYPDENYAREIMQLFSIGLNKLNLDGTAIKDENGNLVPTYTQEDVNELARVFTGWDLKRSGSGDANLWDFFGAVEFTRGDLTHPIEFTPEYHDFGEKKVLGQTIPAGLSGENDIKKAIDILLSNSNVAPFISKNLIMRLTKSNPSPAYVARVATVFNNTGGDLKEVTKAILLDEEIWDDIKNLRSVKFKEPLVALTSLFRNLEIKPLPYWYFCGFDAPVDDNATNCTRVHNKFLFNDPTSYLGQGAGRAPTVFNFYDNSFIPNDANFKATSEVAPEAQIQNDTVLIKFNNEVRVVFNWEEIRMIGGADSNKTIEGIIDNAPADGNIPMYYIGANKYYFNLREDYDFLESRIDGDTDGDFEELKDEYQKGDIDKINQAVREYIDFVDNKLTGGLLIDSEKEVIYKELTKDENGYYNHWAGDDSVKAKIIQTLDEVIRPLYRMIVTSDKFMVE